MTLSREVERRLLQLVIAIGGLVPVGAGLGGAILGSAILGNAMTGESLHGIDLDSHIRYLSGLLLGIGLAFWAAIPHVEKRGPRVQLLTAIVALGGLARVIAIMTVAVPGPSMLFGVTMELVVTPLICLWQARVARRFGI